MALQLENLHIVDEERRIFEGIATIEMADNTGIIVPIDEVEAYMDRYLSRGGTLSLEHTNQHVGKVLEYWRSEILVTPDLVSRAIAVNPKVGHLVRQYEGKTLPAIEVRAQIFKDYPFENQVWERIKDPNHPQALRGLSFGGRSAPVSYDEERKGIVHTVRAAWEFAVCGIPRVALALLTGVNEIAQSDNERELLQSAMETERTCSTCGHKVAETKQEGMTTSTAGANNARYGDEPVDQEKKRMEDELTQGKNYITDPSQAPKGARVQRGSRGGYYYEESGGGSSDTPKPQGGGASKAPPAHTAPAVQEALDALIKMDPKQIKAAVQKLSTQESAHLAKLAEQTAMDAYKKGVNSRTSDPKASQQYMAVSERARSVWILASQNKPAAPKSGKPEPDVSHKEDHEYHGPIVPENRKEEYSQEAEDRARAKKREDLVRKTGLLPYAKLKHSKLYEGPTKNGKRTLHVFYAEGTKSKVFDTIEEAKKFRLQIENEEYGKGEGPRKQAEPVETLNKRKNEGADMPKPDETDSNDKLPVTDLEEVTEADEDASEPGPSEERSESPQSATVDALAAEIAELKSRMASLEERLAPAEPAAIDPAAAPMGDAAPLDEAGNPLEEVTDDAAPAEDAPEKDAPAEGADAPAADEKPAPFEKKDEEDDTKQATPKTRTIESDARGELELKQALQSQAPTYDAAAIARGEKQVSFAELRGHK